DAAGRGVVNERIAVAEDHQWIVDRARRRRVGVRRHGYRAAAGEIDRVGTAVEHADRLPGRCRGVDVKGDVLDVAVDVGKHFGAGAAGQVEGRGIAIGACGAI